MAICVVVFKNISAAVELQTKLQSKGNGLFKIQLIQPNISNPESLISDEIKDSPKINSTRSVNIDTVKLLSPKLARKLRQKTMAFWLMPFGFITGLAFTKMTGLQTFSKLGLDPISEPLIGSFLGMSSGLIGSYFAAGSINTDINDDIGSIRKLNKEGLWLLLIETPFEIELPWEDLKASKNYKLIRINDL
tara:strand:+ start:3885 stop:4457 length:573 start_codon:yes stop_codon:yes gene_type:complete